MSLAKPLFWFTSIYLAVLLVITLLTGMAPLWQFGIVAVVCFSALSIAVWVGRHVLGIPASKSTTDVDVLLDYLRLRNFNWLCWPNCTSVLISA
jgi:hypothetical protein